MANTQPMAPALKPISCPFCKWDRVHLTKNPNSVDITCEGCSATIPCCNDAEDATIRWNTRPATDGLRKDVEVAALCLRSFADDLTGYNSMKIAEQMRQAADGFMATLAATPQAEAAPPVLPSDEEAAKAFGTQIAEALWSDGLIDDADAIGGYVQDVLTPAFAAHRTAHQNAADDGWRDIESAPHEEDVLLYIPANEITPFKIEAGWASGGKITYLSNGQSVSNKWFHGSATHWRPLPTPPSKGRVE